MARIIGAIATSHTPTIGFAHDKKLADDPTWAPIFLAYKPIQAWLEQKRPDALIVIYNDHITSFFFDHYSAFTIGVDDEYAAADEGGGARAMPTIKGHAALARGLTKSLMAQEFDMSSFRDRALDHGIFSPLSMLADAEQGWPWPIVPLQIGVLQFPIPSAKRCFALGRALRRAVAAYPEDIKVAIIGTGGLSHQVHGERCGFNNPVWDATFLDLLEQDPEALTKMTHAEFAERGGFEGSEVIMLLVMRGALAADVRCLHRSYYLPSMTGIATAIYEDVSPHEHGIPFVDAQLVGVEHLAGTYPFTLERSAKGFGVNKFLHELIHSEHRMRFKADPATLMAEFDLTPEEQALITGRDWRGLMHYGAIFFCLEKLAAVDGVSNLQVYAAMRGETLDEFLKTRNAPIQYGTSSK